MTATPTPNTMPRLLRGRARRVLLWSALLALLAVAQSLLVALTLNYESGRAQDEAERVATQAAAEMQRELARQMRELQTLSFPRAAGADARGAAAAMLERRQGLERVEWRSESLAIAELLDTPFAPTLFAQMPRAALATETELACSGARIAGAPTFSRSYFVPLPGGP